MMQQESADSIQICTLSFTAAKTRSTSVVVKVRVKSRQSRQSLLNFAPSISSKFCKKGSHQTPANPLQADHHPLITALLKYILLPKPPYSGRR